VIVVGGDGTFFSTSHFVRGVPMLLVNSNPGTSLALFAACDCSSFPSRVEALLRGRLARTALTRFRVTIGRRAVPELVINDILFAHTNPVAMTRYALEADGTREEQESSGVWISTAAGSTGAALAAGGRMMPLESKKLQFVVREPYTWKKKRFSLLKGFAAHRLIIHPSLFETALWIDGSRTRYDVGPHEPVLIETPADPLVVLGVDPRRRAALFGK
jgi:NAD+ kinase